MKKSKDLFSSLTYGELGTVTSGVRAFGLLPLESEELSADTLMSDKAVLLSGELVSTSSSATVLLLSFFDKPGYPSHRNPER